MSPKAVEVLKDVIAILSPGLMALGASLPGGITGEEWAVVGTACIGALVSWSRRRNGDSTLQW